jgi:hypothetical protein
VAVAGATSRIISGHSLLAVASGPGLRFWLYAASIHRLKSAKYLPITSS